MGHIWSIQAGPIRTVKVEYNNGKLKPKAVKNTMM